MWELWLEGVAEKLAQDPNLSVFNASPNDGWASGHCVCADCSAWDHTGGEPRVFNWYHLNKERPALGDRDVTFANKLGELVERNSKRVAFVRAGLTYTRMQMENIALMDRYWKKQDDGIDTQVRKNWESIEKVVAGHPYSINWGPVRPVTPRMIGLHPDFPPQKAKKAKANDLDLN